MFLVALGQVVRSAAMIHANTNFSHAVAYRKREQHRLVTDGIYACVTLIIDVERLLRFRVVGLDTLHMQGSYTGPWGPNLSYRTPLLSPSTLPCSIGSSKLAFEVGVILAEA